MRTPSGIWIVLCCCANTPAKGKRLRRYSQFKLTYAPYPQHQNHRRDRQRWNNGLEQRAQPLRPNRLPQKCLGTFCRVRRAKRRKNIGRVRIGQTLNSLSDVCGLTGGRELRLLLLLQDRAQSPPQIWLAPRSSFSLAQLQCSKKTRKIWNFYGNTKKRKGYTVQSLSKSTLAAVGRR